MGGALYVKVGFCRGSAKGERNDASTGKQKKAATRFEEETTMSVNESKTEYTMYYPAIKSYSGIKYLSTGGGFWSEVNEPDIKVHRTMDRPHTNDNRECLGELRDALNTLNHFVLKNRTEDYKSAVIIAATFKPETDIRGKAIVVKIEEIDCEFDYINRVFFLEGRG